MFVLIGPHVRPHEMKTVWETLYARGFNPVPLADCPRRQLSQGQIELIIAALPEDAPIKQPEDGHEYVMIELRAEMPAMRRILENALASSIRDTAKIPRWAGGKRVALPIRNPEFPAAALRQIIIVPDEISKDTIKAFFDERVGRGIGN